MPKSKEQKKQIIEDLNQKLAKQKAIVLVDFSGVNSKLFFQLRSLLKQAGCALKVVKKTLLQKVLEGPNYQQIAGKIKEVPGQMAMAFGFGDEVSPAKICHSFQEKNKQLKILGGVLRETMLSEKEIAALAALPSKPELLGKLVGSIQSPLSGFVGFLQGNIKGLLTVLSKIKQ